MLAKFQLESGLKFHSVKPSVKHSFPIQTAQNWANAAAKEVEGMLLDQLSVKKADLIVKPYFTQADVPTSVGAMLPVSTQLYGGARNWVNMPKVMVMDLKQANQQALTHLQNGADGIYFDLTNVSDEVGSLLDQIEWPYCSISFLANDSSVDFLKSVYAFAEKKFNGKQLNGNIFWKDSPNTAIVNAFKNWDSFQSAGLIIPPEDNAAYEIANGLNRAVNHLEKLQQQELCSLEAINQISFSISVGNDFFLEVVKLRVWRMLWETILSAYQINLGKEIFIHVHSPSWVNPSFQPHGNLIHETYSSMAAILGGCDGLSVEPEDINNAMMVRIARNTSSVLREESYLSQVADPLAGSYYIESLTNQLAEQAWKKFQELSAK
jgi:methylmalonyl-CoA mutase